MLEKRGGRGGVQEPCQQETRCWRGDLQIISEIQQQWNLFELIMMITRSTCAWFPCWPRLWWHTLIAENSVRHNFEVDGSPVFHLSLLPQDPYPVTYCEQVTRDQYQSQSQFGSQSALWDLLEAILTDSKMTDKQKRKKLSKFKEGYPDMWR